jgi:hypothetical protein
MSFGYKSDVKKHLSRKLSQHNLPIVEDSPVEVVESRLGETVQATLDGVGDTARPEEANTNLNHRHHVDSQRGTF